MKAPVSVIITISYAIVEDGIFPLIAMFKKYVKVAQSLPASTPYYQLNEAVKVFYSSQQSGLDLYSFCGFNCSTFFIEMYSYASSSRGVSARSSTRCSMAPASTRSISLNGKCEMSAPCLSGIQQFLCLKRHIYIP